MFLSFFVRINGDLALSLHKQRVISIHDKLKIAMKKRLYAALMAVMMLGATSLMAQNDADKGAAWTKMTPESLAKQQTEQLTESLQLNQQQQEAVYRLTLDGARKCKAQCEAMQANGQHCDVAAVKQASDEGWSAQEAAMKKILTAEQYAKWKKMCSDRCKAAGERKMHKHVHTSMHK